nr:FtsX-like permease family protein [Candidatus Sigynarchaeota archaeon]
MFPSFALGFKLVWRNKRRFAVVMSGTIFAISIMASVFLVSNYQGHEMGVMVISSYQPPILLENQGFELNLTEYDELEDLVFEADALGTNIVEKVGRDIGMPSTNGSWGPGSILYFLTKNQTIDWLTFTLNESAYYDVDYDARDDFSNINAMYIRAGRLPTAPKEIMVTSSLATAFSITINDTIAIGNMQTEQLATGFKVVGFNDETGWMRLFMQYDDFRAMISSIAVNDTICSSWSAATFSVYVDLNDVNIYNVNDLASRVTTLSNRIQIGVDADGYDFRVYNRMQYYSQDSWILVIFILLYLGLLLGLLSPIIVLSNYVSNTIGFEMFEKREGEFGQFRSRGFSRNQMIKVISSEIFISALFCATIAGVTAVGLSYIIAPVTSFITPSSMATTPFIPFFSFDTILIYITLVVVLSLLMVLGIYMQPMQLSFYKEMIDTLKTKIKEKRRQSALISGIVTMYIFGAVPLVFYMLIQFLPTSPMYYYFGPIFTILAIASPFLLSLATIKLLGEKFPDRFGKFCTCFLRRNPLKHVIKRNISAKSAKIAKLMIIITFTIAFGLTVKVSERSLTNFKMERNQIQLASDIRADYQDTLSMLNTVKANVTSKVNATSTFFMVSTYGTITNMIDPMFMYSSFKCYMVNVSDVVETSTITKDKFLLDITWNGLESQ